MQPRVPRPICQGTSSLPHDQLLLKLSAMKMASSLKTERQGRGYTNGMGLVPFGVGVKLRKTIQIRPHRLQCLTVPLTLRM